ncbi:MAG: hypothetical protein ABSF90_18240 [Syntrophobacteraceae bacterium]
MTTVCVDPGACGFVCLIEVSRTGKYTAAVRMQSPCKQIVELAAEISEVDFMDIVGGAFGQNQIFLTGARCKLHPSCPIPTALVKAVEAELGMAVKKNVTITLTSDCQEDFDCSQCLGIVD